MSEPVLCKLRDPQVTYQTATGEKLPFEDGRFALVILDNMLDHVHNPTAVLDEVKRVLAKDGLIYLAMNVHTAWGAFLHTILSKLSIDPGHPYTFTADSLRRFLIDNKLTIHGDETADYYHARKIDRESASLKDKIKGYSGLSEFVYYAVVSPAR
jgi:ubiquinone/menaquinone biosynthesis C-methylase UbiE